MANSKLDYLKEEEKATDLRFNRDTYIIVRVDGDKFHNFSAVHNFHKPNDKRALDLMVDAARQVLMTFRGHIPLAYGHSDEFSFLIKSTSNLLSRRVFKITSMLPVVFATRYNSSWDLYFGDPARGTVTKKCYDAWFDARPKEYANYKSVINYFRWRQIDCHINNLYNTTLHALTGRYLRHELIPADQQNSNEPVFENGLGDEKKYHLKRTPITDWIRDSSQFLSPRDATEKLSGTVSSDKHDILFLDHKINYNNELEQFKKGTILVDTLRSNQSDDKADGRTIKQYHVDLTKGSSFWDQNSYIFEDYITCPSL